MALRKVKTLVSGISGDYWKVVAVGYTPLDGKLKSTIALFKDEAHKDTAPIGPIINFEFGVTPEEASGDLRALAYTKIKAYSNSDVPNLDGNGTHKGSVDLAESEDA